MSTRLGARQASVAISIAWTLGAAVFLSASAARSPAQSAPGRAPRTVPLFTTLGKIHRGYDSVAPTAVQYRNGRINPALSAPDGIVVGDQLLLDGFSDAPLSATVDRVNLDVNNVFSIRGRIDGQDGGYVLVSLDGGRVVGSIELPQEDLAYSISPGPDAGLQLVQEQDPHLRENRTDGPPLIPPPGDATRAAARDPLAVSAASGKTKLDLMIVYTPNAKNRMASRGGVNALIARSIEQGQLALDNSAVDIALRLVHSAEVQYTDVDDLTDLYRATSRGDGYMDEIHARRNQYGADLVSVVTTSGCGRGFLLTNGYGSPEYGFTQVAADCFGDLVLVHELGHNLGAHHRKDQPYQPGPGIFPYSAGWRWIGSNNKRYYSVMSYGDSWAGQPVTQVAYFSSPLIQHLGAATGDPDGGDNARTLSETKAVVAGYRPGLAMLTLKATAGGTTSPPAGNTMLSPGSEASATAVPETHFTFLRWSGDASGSANPLTLTMDDDKAVTANFQRIIYPPQNARGAKVANRSLSQVEYINVLNWEANPNNVNVANNKIYRTDGGNRELIATLAATVFEHRHRKVDKDRAYVYEIVAVNQEPRDGQPAVITVR